MTKQKLKKSIIICLVLTVAAIVAFFVLNMIYRDAQTTIIECAGSRGKVYSYDGEYYIRQKDGIYIYPDKKLVSVENCGSITADKDNIYAAVNNSTRKTYSIVIYDRTTGEERKSIAADQPCPLPGAAEEKLYLVYKVTDTLYTLDLESYTIEKIDKEYSKDFKRTQIGKDLVIYSCGNRYVSWQHGNISSTLLGFYVAFGITDNTVCGSRTRQGIKDFEMYCKGDTYQISLGNKDNVYGDFTVSYCDDKTLAFAVTAINKEPGASFPDPSELKNHGCDSVFTYDVQSRERKEKHDFRTFERVIGISADHVVTYYKGKYLTYSRDGWKVVSEQKTGEIKKDGKYYFETCGEYVFVFDDDTGECINRIKI